MAHVTIIEEHAHFHVHTALRREAHSHMHPIAQKHPPMPEPEVPLSDGHLRWLLEQSIEYEKAKKEEATA